MRFGCCVSVWKKNLEVVRQPAAAHGKTFAECLARRADCVNELPESSGICIGD
jgi:hypothetical protein